MALSSPGVEVSVIDESFYTPAGPGTVAMIFVTSAANKPNGSRTGTAPGTLTANAGTPYLLTSQRDLVETFGDPVFQIDSNNNPIHGSEINEYGLQAAYSLLGVSNRVYVTRADIDLSQLVPQARVPANTPADGTYWLDTANTSWGVFEWNNATIPAGGQTFTNKAPVVITDPTQVVNFSAADYTPKGSVGRIGQYAIVAVTNLNTLWYKNSAGTWVEVGTTAWKQSWPVVRGTITNPTLTPGTTITIEGSSVVLSGATVNSLVSDINGANIAGISAAAVGGALEIYSTGATTALDSIQIGENSGDDVLAALGIAAGNYFAPKLQISPHTSVPEFKLTDTENRPTGSVWIKTTEPNAGARWRVKIFNGGTRLFDEIPAPIYQDNAAALFFLDRSGGGINLPVGSLYVKYNVAEEATLVANLKLYRRASAGPTTITSSVIPTSIVSGTFTMQATEAGAISLQNAVTITSGTTADSLANAINSAGLVGVEASVDSQNRLTISHVEGGDIRFVDTNGVLASIGFAVNTTSNLYYAPGTDNLTSPAEFVATNWAPLTHTSSPTAPSALAADGTLWYNSIVDEVDIMIHNGNTWVGYRDPTAPYYSLSFSTDPAGPIVAASQPTTQSDGTALVNGDLWIDTSDLENYPTIYKYSQALQQWVLLDKTDQTTEEGVLFADARWAASGAASGAPEISELLTSNYLDPDAPDPALYPKGMLLWNTRRSGFNVKKFVRNYIDLTADNGRFNNGEAMSGYYPHRWVTESGNQEDGSGSFGRKAQRKVVIQSLQAMVNSNQDIRDNEARVFNLMACPGYPELIGEMISLNYDRGLDAFIVGDSPARLTPDATSLNNWGNNVNLAVEDNDRGLVSSDEYLGVFYPWGFSSDNAGNNVVIPPSHMILRTITLSDQVSYPWFAPAGTRRGGVTNATSTGYINSEGEFVTIALNEGQRDTLYGVSVNPITFITGAGLVNYGQKTRARAASALDRINVARLVIYLRRQLNILAKPYIFEPNDKTTRDQIKQSAESLLLELTGQRALYDYIVVCDETNNTPARIDRNELYLDIAIEPVKAVEFIYIPLRIFNTGEISGAA
jgi:hypothetical protein